MKTVQSLLAAVLLAGFITSAGCGIAGMDGGASFPDTSSSDSALPNTSSDDDSPRLVTPIDGPGGPVFAQPIGGGLYVPLDGTPGGPFTGV